MIRTPEALIPYVLAIAAVLGGMAWHLGDQVGGLGRTIVTGEASIGGPFVLTDQNGETYTDKNLHGHWTLLYFGYTHCPDVCPLTLEMIADTMDKLGAKASRVQPVFITVDPARDTPAVMKQYVASFGKTFAGLTGSDAQIAQVLKEFRVYAKKHPLPGGDYSMDHSSEIYLLDPSGKFAGTYEEVQGPDKIADDLKGKL
ncbi:MAG TPA: SCO family protein [Rhizomicrobium sp.]|jgi:protein SCO1/2